MRRALTVIGTGLIVAALTLAIASLSIPAAPSTTPGAVATPAETVPPVVTTVEPDALDAASDGPPAPLTHTITDIRQMNVGADGVISPPTFDHVYRVNGLPDGPMWLAAHARSAGRGTAPGNTFATFASGDRIEALGAAWRVVERWDAAKSDADEQGPLMAPDRYAGHLILVSCLPRARGAATSNTWLVAEPIGAP
jgi:hypothetical protein